MARLELELWPCHQPVAFGQALPKRPGRKSASRTSLQVCKAAGKQRLELLNDGLHAQHALPGPPVGAQPVDGRLLAELCRYLQQQRQRRARG